MFAKNHIVSVRQMRRLLVLDLFAGTSLFLPAAVGRLTGKAGIFAIALGAVAAGIFALFLLNTGRGCKDGYTAFCTQTLGKWGGRVYLLIYALKYFISAALLLGVFAQIVNHTFLTDIPRIVLGVALLAVCAYCTSKGVETRARLGEMLVYFIIIPVVIIIVLALPQIQLERLWPIELLNDGGTAAGSMSAAVNSQIAAGSATAVVNSQVAAGGASAAIDFQNAATAGAGGWRGFIWAAVATFSLFSTIEWLLFLRPNVRRPQKARRGVLMSILWPTLLCILILITCIGVFSIEGMNGENWPTVILMQIVRFPGGFLSRQDGLMLAFWMAGIFILISGCMNYGSESLKTIFPGYRKAWMIVFPAAFVFVCFLIIHQQNASALYIAFMIFAYMPLSILLPLFLRLVHWLRRSAGKAGPAEHENRSRRRGKKTAGRAVKSAGEKAAGPSGRTTAKQTAGQSGKVLGLLLPLIIVSGLLGGCGRAVQIEDRNYVMCLGIDKAEDGLSVSYGFPDLKALTGDGDNIHYPVSTIDGKDMDAAAEAYGKQANKRLDFGQLQMIVFGRNIIEDPKAMAEVLEYIKNHQEFTRTVLVCMADKTAKDIVALDEDVNGSIGIYLRQMFENNSKEYQLTVGDLIIGISLPEEKQEIAVISKGKDVPVIKSIADVVGYYLAKEQPTG